MARNPLDVEVPAGTDAFDPQGDMVELGDSLKGHVVIPAPNQAARLALLTSVGSSADDPLIVRQGDTGVYWEHDGTAWRALFGGGTAPRVLARNGDGAAMPAGTVPFIQAWPVQDNRSAAGIITVTYPTPFTVRPLVFAKSVSGATADPVVNADSASTTAVSLIWPGTNGGTVRVHMLAIGW